MKYSPVFGSKKATVTIVGAVLTMFLTVMPVFFPDVDQSIFQDAADFIMKIVLTYLPSQAVVDVAKAIKQNNEQIAA